MLLWNKFILFLRNKRELFFRFLAVLGGIFLSGTILFIFWQYRGSCQLISSFPSETSSLTAWRQTDWFFEFDRPVRSDWFYLEIEPNVSGELTSPSFWGWSRRIIFRPDYSLQYGQEYQVYLKKINLLGQEQKFSFSFQTLKEPELLSIAPESGYEGFGLSSVLSLCFDVPVSPGKGFYFVFSPEAEVSVAVNHEEDCLTIKPVGLWAQEKDYLWYSYWTSEIYDFQKEEIVSRGNKNLISQSSFQTVLSPQISSVSLSGEGITVSEPLQISFTKNMDKNQSLEAIQLVPEVLGEWSWAEDGLELTFTPEEWAKETVYTLTLPEGLKDQQGAVLAEEKSYSFTTIGPVEVAQFFPVSGSSEVAIDSYISVHFNQEVDLDSAEDHFEITPSVSGSFLRKSQVLTFVPESNLQYDRDYKVTLSAGIKTIYGLDSRQDFSSTFHTRPYQISLNVPLLHQQQSHTCNLACARMVLAYRGVSLSENQILQEVGIDSTPYQPNIGIWGDPDSGYVGATNGQPKGYGVHWGPIARVINQYRSAEVKRSWNLPDLLTEVEAGNPVILWWQNGWTSPDTISWKTPAGKQVNGVEGMHSEVVIGFVGDRNNPSQIIVNDPWRGLRSYTQSYFSRMWGYYQNTAVVVR